jgi:hypothetical protein
MDEFVEARLCNENAEDGTKCNCRPKMVLTCQEEDILVRMRKIKDEVRSIIEFTGPSEQAPTRLDELRAKWEELETRLDQAIDNKFIMLGHRPPTVGFGE